MLTYIFMRLYAQANDPATVQLITVSGIVSIIVAIVIALLQYKSMWKGAKSCWISSRSSGRYI